MDLTTIGMTRMRPPMMTTILPATATTPSVATTEVITTMVTSRTPTSSRRMTTPCSMESVLTCQVPFTLDMLAMATLPGELMALASLPPPLTDLMAMAHTLLEPTTPHSSTDLNLGHSRCFLKSI